jgi:hypothetical protein
MHKKYEIYPDQFTPADLTDAHDYLRFCLTHQIVIDFDSLTPQMVADLYILKARMLSYY